MTIALTGKVVEESELAIDMSETIDWRSRPRLLLKLLLVICVFNIGIVW